MTLKGMSFPHHIQLQRSELKNAEVFLIFFITANLIIKLANSIARPRWPIILLVTSGQRNLKGKKLAILGKGLENIQES